MAIPNVAQLDLPRERQRDTLQNIPAVLKDTIAWITEQPLASSAEGRWRGHLSGDTASAAPHLDYSAEFSPHDDEYARYRGVPESRIEAECEARRLRAVNLAGRRGMD